MKSPPLQRVQPSQTDATKHVKKRHHARLIDPELVIRMLIKGGISVRAAFSVHVVQRCIAAGLVGPRVRGLRSKVEWR